MEPFEHKRPRCPNWTEQDKIILVKNIRSRRDILFARTNKGDSGTKEAITTAWQEVLQALNTETHFPRTLEQVKKQHENLKLRAKQLYMDMLQCTGAVKPHILSPAMKLMMDDFTDSGNTSPQSLIFEDFSNTTPQPVFDRVWLAQSTLPPPPLTSSVQTIAGSSVNVQEEDSNTDESINDSTSQNNSLTINRNPGPSNQGSSTNITNQGSSTNITNQGSSTNITNQGSSTNIRNCNSFNLTNGINIKSAPDELVYPAAKRQKLDDLHTKPMLVRAEMEKIEAETEKLRAETELIYQRKEYEHAIFELKRQVLEAKLEYYSQENERRAMSDQSENLAAKDSSKLNKYIRMSELSDYATEKQ